jgi:cyclic pyranopterin phosphate synthase
MPECIQESCKKERLSIEEMKNICSVFISQGIDKIRLTGGEPLIKKGILDLIQYISSYPQVKDIAITTNGLLLEEMAVDLKKAGLKRINISLDSLVPEKFFEMTRGGDLSKVLRGIELAEKIGLGPIKLNVVLINGFNDDEIENFVDLTRDRNIEVRFIELMPIGEVANWSLDHFISNEEILRKVPQLQKVNKENISSPATYYKLPNSKGKIGLISPITCNFCENCNRIRVTSQGYLKHCLHSNEEFDLKAVISNKDSIKDLIKQATLSKKLRHQLEEGNYISRNMVQVGG